MLNFRKCSDRDIPELKGIWLRCFDECEEAAELFFQRNKTDYQAYACESGSALVSALYLIDCTLNGAKAHYLCGAATLPQFRGRGIMKSLIEYALDDAARRGDRYSLLFPASETLYGFYAVVGYLPACAAKTAELSTDNCSRITVGSPELQALQAECYRNNFLLWNNNFIRFAAEYYACYGAETVQSANCFSVFQREGDFAEVYYAIYNDIKELKSLLCDSGIKKFRLTAPADSDAFDGEIIRPYGMIRSLGESDIHTDVFIGITLQ